MFGTVLNKPEYHAANIYLLKVNNKNSRKRIQICSRLTTNTPERRK